MEWLAWPLALTALGLLLLVAELWIPSGGLIGAAAGGCLLYSLWLAFEVSRTVGMAFLAGELGLAPVVGAAALYVWPKTPIARRLRLPAPAEDEVENAHGSGRLDHLIGRRGRVETPLRPTGTVLIDGLKLEAVSEHALIPAGRPVVAVRAQAGRVVVRECESSEHPDEMGTPPGA
jgi:membrane-bound ClpP family serine protease